MAEGAQQGSGKKLYVLLIGGTGAGKSTLVRLSAQSALPCGSLLQLCHCTGEHAGEPPESTSRAPEQAAHQGAAAGGHQPHTWRTTSPRQHRPESAMCQTVSLPGQLCSLIWSGCAVT